MPKSVAEPTILLLQARRPDDPARVEERASFAAKCGVAVERVVPWNLLDSPPTLTRIRRHDALMVGGSGEFYVSNASLPGFAEVLESLREVVEVGHPAFASCFGFQMLVKALGGEIVYDPERVEVGTYPLRLTDAGRTDPLFSALPDRFPAQMGRKDRATRLPPGLPNLAASELCPFQAFAVPGKPIWATQFHPELDARTNRGRFLRYMEGYAASMTDDERRAALERFDESPETEALLPRFLELVFG